MENYQENKTICIRLEKEIYDKIKELALHNDRSFSKQVQFIIKKYLEITNS